MAPSTRNTEGLTPRTTLDTCMSAFPPGESPEDMYQTALLMTAVFRDAHPHIDVAAWLRWGKGERN